MANLILTETGWQSRIQSKLGVESAYLPDADIEQPDIIDVAEAKIIEQISDYAILTGTKLTYLRAATVCQCAILLCPSMSTRLPVKEQGPQFSRDIVVDWDKKMSALQKEQDGYLMEILDYEDTVSHFGLAGPQR